MPAPFVGTGSRVTFFFDEGSGGFSESLAYKGSISFADLKVKSIALIKARLNMCGNGVRFVGARMSVLGTRRVFAKILASDPALAMTNPPPATDATAAASADPRDTAVLVEFKGESERTKMSYLAGMPDALINIANATGINLGLAPGWDAKFSAWRSLILNGVGVPGAGTWGFVGKQDPAVQPFHEIQFVGVQPDRLNVIVYLAAGVQGQYALGQLVQVIGNRRISSDFRGINGTQVVESVGAIVGGTFGLELRNTASVDTTKFLPGSLGSVRPLRYQVFQATAAEPIKITTRKRGGRFLLRRGRQRTRRLLP